MLCWAVPGVQEARAASPSQQTGQAAAAIPELELGPQDNLLVTSRDTANWVLSYPAVLPLVPPPRASWAESARESVARGALAETIFLLESTPPEHQDDDWRVYRANLLLRIGLIEEAESALRTALQMAPDHPKALALASVVASARGRKEDAADLARRATQLDPTSGAAWLALSYTQQIRGELDAALASTRRAQAEDSGNGTAWIREAELHLALGRIPAAREAADRALSLQPSSYIAHSTRALVALLQQDAKAARSGFEQATRLNPVDANARFGLSLAHIQNGDLPRARDELEIAVDKAPENSLFISYLGRVHLALGETERARQLFERAKMLDPNNPSTWLFSGQMHLRENRPSSALDDIRASIRHNEDRKVYRGRDLLDSDRVLNQIDLTNTLLALGFTDLALNAASAATDTGGANSAAYRNLADTYGQVSHGTQARRSLALRSLFDAPPGQLPMALDVVPGIGSSANVPNHSLPAGVESRQIGLNEYSALFAPSGWHLALDGNIAGYDTVGEQVRLAGRAGSLGIGFAQLSQRSDGLDGRSLDNDAWQGLLHASLNAGLSAFLEYRHATSLRDEILFPYDPLLVSPMRLDERVRVARLGMSWHPDTHQSVKLLFSRQWRDQDTTFTDYGFSAEAPGTADMPEIQYQRDWRTFTLVLGASRFDDSGDYVYSFDPDTRIPSETTARLAYGYGTWHAGGNLAVTLGFGHVDFEQAFISNTHYDKVLPKFGLRWRPFEGAQLRLSALKAAALPKAGGASLEPVEVAGMQQWFGDEVGTLHRRIGLAWSQELTPALSLLLEAGNDRLSIPGDLLGTTTLDHQYERQNKAGLYWRLPESWLAAWEGGLRLTYDRLDQDRPNLITDNNALRRQIARHWTLGGQFSGPHGLGFSLALTRVDADQVIEDLATSALNAYQDRFWMTDLALTWKPGGGRRQLSLGIRNAADRDIGHYVEPDPLMPRFAQKRFVYARLQWQFD